MKESIGKFFKWVGIIFLTLIGLLFLLYLWGEITSQYNYNHKYSIAMPTIVGNYYNINNIVKVSGLENIINEQIASISYNETSCFIQDNICYENRFSIAGLGNQISIFPYSHDYPIKYKDKNKIVYGDYIENTTCEIDLIMETLTCTLKKAGFENKPRKIEVITDDKEIEKLEKKIIRKYLKKEWFK